MSLHSLTSNESSLSQPTWLRTCSHFNRISAWLDDEDAWFWFGLTKRNSIVTKIDKILAVAPRVELSDLRRGVSRHYRTEGFAPPKRVLGALCNQLPDCAVENGSIVVDTRPRKAEKILPESERILYRVLQESGPVMSTVPFESECRAAGLNRATFWALLLNSPIIRRYATGVYGLIATEVLASEIEALQTRRQRKGRVLRDCGWTESGEAWISYRLSKASIRNGVLGIPNAMAKHVSGTFAVGR